MIPASTHPLLDRNLQHYLLLVEDVCSSEQTGDWTSHWAIVSYGRDREEHPIFLTFPSSNYSMWNRNTSALVASTIFKGIGNDGGLVTIADPQWRLYYCPGKSLKLGPLKEIERLIGLWEVPHEVLRCFLTLLAL